MGVQVTVFLPTLLARCAQGKREVDIQARTLDECVESLIIQYPLLEIHLFKNGRQLRPHLNAFYNDKSLKQLEDWRVPVRPGDTLTFLQAVSGG